jgi:hypothetical protein
MAFATGEHIEALTSRDRIVGNREGREGVNSGTDWYSGRVTSARVQDEGRTECGVAFDDGRSSQTLAAEEFIRSFAAGKRVEARYNREDDWYSGTIKGRRAADGLFVIQYDDGDEETLEACWIRNKPFAKGDRVEALYDGGEWYPGTVQSVHGNMVKINFDDGDEETHGCESIRMRIYAEDHAGSDSDVDTEIDIDNNSEGGSKGMRTEVRDEMNVEEGRRTEVHDAVKLGGGVEAKHTEADDDDDVNTDQHPSKKLLKHPEVDDDASVSDSDSIGK